MTSRVPWPAFGWTISTPTLPGPSNPKYPSYPPSRPLPPLSPPFSMSTAGPRLCNGLACPGPCFKERWGTSSPYESKALPRCRRFILLALPLTLSSALPCNEACSKKCLLFQSGLSRLKKLHTPSCTRRNSGTPASNGWFAASKYGNRFREHAWTSASTGFRPTLRRSTTWPSNCRSPKACCRNLAREECHSCPSESRYPVPAKTISRSTDGRITPHLKVIGFGLAAMLLSSRWALRMYGPACNQLQREPIAFFPCYSITRGLPTTWPTAAV